MLNSYNLFKKASNTSRVCAALLLINVSSKQINEDLINTLIFALTIKEKAKSRIRGAKLSSF
jgi:hypothetical protein